MLVRWFAGYCVECGKGYIIASEFVSSSLYCSATCARRTSKRARRAREHGATGSFTWDGFAKLTQSLGNLCSYCGTDNEGQPFEPDHVVPLSRGGHNGLTNILPACRRCNGQKRDLLPAEWDRQRRLQGHAPIRFERFTHLTAHVFLTSHAA